MLHPASIGVHVSASRMAIMGLRQALGSKGPLAHEIVGLDDTQPMPEQVDGIKRRLSDFIAGHRLETASRYLAIPSPAVIWRRMTLPAAARENLADTIRYEAEKYLPLPLEEFYWDYQLIDENRAAGELAVLLVVARRSDMAPFIELAANLPGGLSGIEPATSAIANVCHRHEELVGENAYVLAAVTSDQLHLLHMRNGVPLGARAYNRPESPDAIPALICKGLDAFSLPVEAESDALGYPAALYAEASDEALIEPLGAACPHFAWRQAAWRENGLPVPDMLPAYGLALRGLHKPALSINMLPLRLRKQPSRLGRFLMAGLVVLSLLSGLAWGGSILMQKRNRHLRLDRDVSRLAAEAADIDRLQSDVQEIRARLEFLQKQHRGAYDVLDILKALTEIIPDTAWVREITIEPKSIRLDGYADAATELIPLIDASPMFTDVSFLAAITKGRDGKEKFRIGFKLADD